LTFLLVDFLLVPAVVARDCRTISPARGLTSSRNFFARLFPAPSLGDLVHHEDEKRREDQDRGDASIESDRAHSPFSGNLLGFGLLGFFAFPFFAGAAFFFGAGFFAFCFFFIFFWCCFSASVLDPGFAFTLFTVLTLLIGFGGNV